MKKSSSSSYHSPEKTFLVCALFLFLLYEGSFFYRIYQRDRALSSQPVPAEEMSTEDSSKKIDALRWLAPFKSMNYQNNPFDIGFRLKIRKPPEPPKPVVKKVAVKKKPPVPVRKVLPPPPPPPPKIYSIGYQGSYTNLAGVSYAILQVTDKEKKLAEKKYLVRGDSFAEYFQLLDFDGSEARIGIRNQKRIAVLWNDSRDVSIPREKNQKK